MARILVRLIFYMLLFGNQPGMLAFDFQYSSNGTNNFSLLVPVNDSTYDGSSPAYVGGDVWLTPDPRSPQEVGNYTKIHNVGRFIWKEPVDFVQQVGNAQIFTSFTTSFQFQIITAGNYGYSGDGLAFFISPQDAPPHNSTADLLGLASRSDPGLAPSPFLAVEFDTFQNGEMEDPSPSHIGIDVNSLISIATYNTNSTDSPLFLYNNYTFTAWVEYNSSSHLVQVWMINDTTSQEHPLEPSLTNLTVDLSTVFNGSVYVGFSVGTGGSYEGNVIYSWNFSTNDGLSQAAGCLNCHQISLLHILLIVFAVAIVFIVLILVVLWRIRRRKKVQRQPAGGGRQLSPNIEMAQYDSVPRYSYSELRRATNGFSDKLLVGQGAFSRVYKGTLQVHGSTQFVAVKKLHDGSGEEASFPSEVKIISSIRHRNLLQLHGWCYHKGKALLVYQYMPNGSLDHHLFKHKEGNSNLPSDTRFNILIGVAAALEYLHEGLGECVLHRDVKAANVLLNKDFEALLGDFGIARLISHNMMVTMTAAGTPGYLAPEAFFTGKATDRADVYSFGVLALEVACGRRVLDAQLQPQEMNLVEWVWLLQQSSKVLEAIDPILMAQSITNCDEADFYNRWRCVLHIGLACCHPLPQSRPTMRQVHQLLKKTTIITLPSSRPQFPYSESSNTTMPLSVSGSIDFSMPSSFTTVTTTSSSFGS